jgi:Bacterial Ig-like domain
MTLLATAAAVLAAMCFMAGPASGGSAVYSNASTITIPDSGTASPYRLRVTAVDAAGNRSVTRTRRFRIVRG